MKTGHFDVSHLKNGKKNPKKPFISYKILFFLDSLLCTLMEILDNLRLESQGTKDNYFLTFVS